MLLFFILSTAGYWLSSDDTTDADPYLGSGSGVNEGSGIGPDGAFSSGPQDSNLDNSGSEGYPVSPIDSGNDDYDDPPSGSMSR